MRHLRKMPFLSLALVFVFAALAFGGYAYKTNKPHIGGDVTPAEAHEMLMKHPEDTFLVDCRTRPEYQLVGQPDILFSMLLRSGSSLASGFGSGSLTSS
jgi:hypothetical protein